MSSLSRALLIAAALHAAAMLSLSSRPTEAPAAASAQPGEPLEVSLLPPPPPAATGAEATEPPPDPAAGRAGASAARAAARSGPPTAAPRPAREEPPGEGAGDDAAVPSPLAEAATAARPPVRFTLSAGELARSVETGPASGPRAAGGQAASDRELGQRLELSLRDHQIDHDRRVGVGGGGVAATALREATLGPQAPQEGDAIFSVVTDQASRVTAVTLLSGGASWEVIGRQALAALAGRALPRAASRRIRVQVRARYQYPSGSKQRVQVKLPFQEVPGSQAAPLGQGQPAPRHAHAPGPARDHRDWMEETAGFKRAQEMLSRLAAGVVVDPADLAARQQRVVSVVVLDEEAL